MRTTRWVAGLAACAAIGLGARTTAAQFVDVPRSHWAYQAVEDLRQRGIVVGYPDGTETKRKSGIEGTAEVGPIRPVERPGEKNTRPLPGAVITVHRGSDGKEVARAKSDKLGRFRMTVPAGDYRIVPLPPNPKSRFPIGRPQEVTVTTGEMSRVTVHYDSGIR